MSQDGTGKAAGGITAEERRAFVRVRKDVRVNCRVLGGPDREDPVRSRNLGTGGLLIYTREPLPVGTRVQIRATIEDPGVELTTGGRVVWSDFDPATSHYEAGICFVGLNPVQRRNVMALLGTHLSMMDGLERRHFIRLEHRLLVEYRAARGWFRRWRPVYASNISLGGVALVLQGRLRSGVRLELRIHLDDGTERPLSAEGVVVARTEMKEAANEWLVSVRFQELPDETRHHLGAYISKRLTAPAIRSVTAPLAGSADRKGTSRTE